MRKKGRNDGACNEGMIRMKDIKNTKQQGYRRGGEERRRRRRRKVKVSELIIRNSLLFYFSFKQARLFKFLKVS